MYEQNIQPVQLVESIKQGYSKPQNILFSNGRQYAVKFKNNPSGTRILVNEYIAGRLGQILSLPIVPFEVVKINDDFINEHPILLQRKFTSGSQFASLFIDNCIQLERDSQNENITVSNKNHLAKIIVFDLWIGNTDRKENNVLLEPNGQGEYFLYMIDHGRCFSNAKWTVKTLEKMPKLEVTLNVHKWFAGLLQSENEIQSAIKEIMNIPEEIIRDVIQSIPDDWDVTVSEREALVAHLVNAQQLLPQLQIQRQNKDTKKKKSKKDKSKKKK
ncbi:HipA family kinase [Bacillus sp. Marseille-P3661]|uniref:HipA family kinase n=1 Tax=Bacillus sp. Marseille-P3661 TaxID=1936234 RepID=UPI000C8555E5|nr:HipA family kinase [Bacillus sp. Marseille-P3661]